MSFGNQFPFYHQPICASTFVTVQQKTMIRATM